MKSQPSSTIKRGLRRQLNILEDSDFGVVNKKEINKMAENVRNNKRNNGKRNNNQVSNKPKSYGDKTENSGIAAPELCGQTLEYTMSRDLADEILKKNKQNPQETLCAWVNEQFDLKGYCVRVIVEKANASI
jgi:hypothetical protein